MIKKISIITLIGFLSFYYTKKQKETSSSFLPKLKTSQSPKNLGVPVFYDKKTNLITKKVEESNNNKLLEVESLNPEDDPYYQRWFNFDSLIEIRMDEHPDFLGIYPVDNSFHNICYSSDCINYLVFPNKKIKTHTFLRLINSDLCNDNFHINIFEFYYEDKLLLTEELDQFVKIYHNINSTNSTQKLTILDEESKDLFIKVSCVPAFTYFSSDVNGIDDHYVEEIKKQVIDSKESLESITYQEI